MVPYPKNIVRIGFSGIYSWRPHVEHLYFLSSLVKSAGHEVFFLTCDGDLPSCYTRELRGRLSFRECLQCRLGGIRSFPVTNIASVGQMARGDHTSSPSSYEWAKSSASTLGRFESDEEYSGEAFRLLASRLEPAVSMGFSAAKEWIRHKRLDAICVFNGRMDVTRAIYEAAKALGVRVVSLERTWFGDGLQILPEENCLGLRAIDGLVAEWRDRPLTRVQALRSAELIATRFLRTKSTEWRAYNRSAQVVPWPIENARRKILLLPGSRNEVWGHADWTSGWVDSRAAYDAIMCQLGLEQRDVVLRCHPNWSENIGKQDGRRAEDFYSSWAGRVGVLSIPSASTVSTIGLIRQCDAIVVTNGSAALEAGILGKQVIGIGPSTYQEAGIRDRLYSFDDLSKLRLHATLGADELSQVKYQLAMRTLRFCYTASYRIPQYTDSVRAERATKVRFDERAVADRFLRLLRTGTLEADDPTCAMNDMEEKEVLDMIAAEKWSELALMVPQRDRSLSPLQRRWLYRAIDLAGAMLPAGDR